MLKIIWILNRTFLCDTSSHDSIVTLLINLHFINLLFLLYDMLISSDYFHSRRRTFIIRVWFLNFAIKWRSLKEWRDLLFYLSICLLLLLYRLEGENALFTSCLYVSLLWLIVFIQISTNLTTFFDFFAFLASILYGWFFPSRIEWLLSRKFLAISIERIV